MADTDHAALVAHRWIELDNHGASPNRYGSDRFLELYAPDVLWMEAPTSWFPEGRSGGLAEVRAALEASQPLLCDRRADLHDVIADGSQAAMRYTWSAVVAADGLSVPAGTRASMEVAAFLLVRNGRIVEIREILSGARA